jgi:hypothetical protein
MYVARYAANGDLRWARLATGGNDAELTNNSALVALSNDDLIYGGPFSDDTVVAPGGADAIALDGGGFPQNELLARFDGLGRLIWAEQSLGSTTSNSTYYVVSLTNDSIVLLGWTNTVPVTVAVGQTGETTYSAGGDTVLAKFDADGQLIWSKLEGGSNSSGEAAAVGPFDTIVVVGRFTEPAATFGGGEANETTLTTDDSSFFVIVESP